MLKYSKQREIIAETVKSHISHPSAGQVYDYLRPLYPNISLGTVYRNLSLLSETGVIRKLRMPDGCDRFDGSAGEHAHVVCDRCGAVKDIEITLEQGFADLVLDQTGFEMTGSQLSITGICESCRQK